MWESDKGMGMVVGWGGVGRGTHGVAQTVFSSEYRLNYLIGKLRELHTLSLAALLPPFKCLSQVLQQRVPAQLPDCQAAEATRGAD